MKKNLSSIIKTIKARFPRLSGLISLGVILTPLPVWKFIMGWFKGKLKGFGLFIRKSDLFTGLPTPGVGLRRNRKKRVVMYAALGLLLLLGPLAYFVSRHPPATEAAWWDDGWMYWKNQIINYHQKYND